MDAKLSCHLLYVGLFLIAGCGGSAPATTPSSPTPVPAPPASSQTVPLTGRITSWAGGPVAGATVSTMISTFVADFSTTTDANGDYRFPFLRAGFVTVRATAPGFQ